MAHHKRNTSAQRPYTSNQGGPGGMFDGRSGSQNLIQGAIHQQLKISNFQSLDHIDYHKNPQPDDDTFQTGNMPTVPNEHDNSGSKLEISSKMDPFNEPRVQQPTQRLDSQPSQPSTPGRDHL